MYENSVAFILYIIFLFILVACCIAFCIYVRICEKRQEKDFYNSLSEEEKHLIDKYNRAKVWCPSKKEKKINEN